MPLLAQICNRRFLVAFSMGFASGLPLLVTLTLLQARAAEAGVNLRDIGLMTLVGLPYTLKFLWAPLFDRFRLPFLGRRRGWLFFAQLALAAAIVVMGLADPGKSRGLFWVFVSCAFAVAFLSASQDIVIDAYRREDLADNELGLGSSFYIYGYRLGMLAVSAGGMILADHAAWEIVFFVMALCLLPGILTTLSVREPAMPARPPAGLKESVLEPFSDFLRKDGAVWMLVFVLLYKMGDNLAAALSTPFFLETGFSKTEIGSVVKLFGFWATMAGSFIGGVVILKVGINRSLWIFGFLQMLSTAGFALLARVGPSLPVLAGVISFENLSAGMGTAAFIAFMASVTSRRFSASQYALLTSLMGVPRVLVSSGSGFLAESMGWFAFFLLCTIIALPGILLLRRFAPWRKENETVRL